MANLNPGIHENVSLAKIAYSQGPEWEAVDLMFAKDDMFYKHRVFKPKPENAERTRDHINYILGHFTTREKIKECKGKDFKDFAEKLVELYKDEKMYKPRVHIKLMTNEKGYANIPSFMTHGFIQDGDITCSLEYTDWEISKGMAPKMEPSQAAPKPDISDDDSELPF